MSILLRHGYGLMLSLLLITLMPLSVAVGVEWGGDECEALPVLWQSGEDSQDEAEHGGDLPGLLPLRLPVLIAATPDKEEYPPLRQGDGSVSSCSARAPPLT